MNEEKQAIKLSNPYIVALFTFPAKIVKSISNDEDERPYAVYFNGLLFIDDYVNRYLPDREPSRFELDDVKSEIQEVISYFEGLSFEQPLHPWLPPPMFKELPKVISGAYFARNIEQNFHRAKDLHEDIESLRQFSTSLTNYYAELIHHEASFVPRHIVD